MSTQNHKPATTSDILLGASAMNPSIQQSSNPSSSGSATDQHQTCPAHPASGIQNPEPVFSPSTPDTRHSTTHKSNNPFALRARCGKVARLPKEVRDQLNEMLLDGVPHAKIIQILRDKFGPPAVQPNVLSLRPSNDTAVPTTPAQNSAQSDPVISPSIENQNGSTSLVSKIENASARVRGSSIVPTEDQSLVNDHESPITNHATHGTEDVSSHPVCSIQNPEPNNPSASEIGNLKLQIANLTAHHITTWKQHGGYRDWLKDRQRIEECKLRNELTIDLARSAEGLASYQAAPKVAVAQICQTIIDLGPGGLKDAMKDSPLNCFRLLNALARLINSGLKCENQIQKNAIETYNEKRQPINRAELRQIELDLNLL